MQVKYSSHHQSKGDFGYRPTDRWYYFNIHIHKYINYIYKYI
jgi:hypothetical protein